MSPLKLLVRTLRVLSGVVLLYIVFLLIPTGIPYLENAQAYGWVRWIQEVDDATIGFLKSIAPTKAGGYELARFVLIALTYTLSRLLESAAVFVAKKAANTDLNKRYEQFKRTAGLAANSRTLAPIKKRMDALSSAGDSKSREELIQLMIETKKKLESMSRDLAFLSIDVVGSTEMKLGEDKAFIEHDFREYKKMVERIMEREAALKSAWTPDGAMICLPTVDAAVRAAQNVLLALQRFNAEVKTVKTEFRVRCGVNAGPVHYDKATPLEEMSDHVIDVAGHMQKHALPDTIFIGRHALESASEIEGFKPAERKVDDFEVYLWKAPTADPTAVRTTPPVASVRAPDAGATSLAALRELTDPNASSSRNRAADPFAPIAQRTSLSVPRMEAFPEHLGKYELKREIGRGAMGVVYEGWDPSIERRVAIKTIRQDQLHGDEAHEILARFQREAKAAGQLSHPNVVSVYEFAQQAGISFIAMEYIEGRELKEFFDKGDRFPLGEVVRLMTQLLDALEAAGKKGIVHRDIKPGNIIILEDGTLKVADFGIARIESSQLTQTGAAIGTPSYMSPEQLLGTPVDPRSDLFSAGVVLYQFLTGEKPFSGERATTVITKVLSEQPQMPSALDLTIPRSFDAPARKALAKKPDDRFQTAREFAEALRAAYEHRGEEEGKKAAATGGNESNAAALARR